MLVTATKSGSKEFFAIDSRIWKALSSDDVNRSIAYLVLACGTGSGNKATNWSTQAVMKYAGRGWQRAKDDILSAIEDGFVRRGATHTKERPRSELATFPEFMCSRYAEAEFDRFDLSLLTAIKAGEQPKSASQLRRARSLAMNDCLWRDRAGRYWLPSEIPQDSSEYLIWLPNSIVTGASSGEEPPIHRLRSAEPWWATGLFVDLYAEHNLPDYGGISPATLSMRYDRKELAKKGAYVIWGFREKGLAFGWQGPFDDEKWHFGPKDRWNQRVEQNVGCLRDLGLLSFVPHIYDRERDGEPLHAYGIGATGDVEIERKIGDAARRAANAMLSKEAREKAEAEGFDYLCPIHRSKTSAQMIGVGRLTYRPHTMRTARWFAGLMERGPAWIETFDTLASGAEGRRELQKTSKRVNEGQEYQRNSTMLNDGQGLSRKTDSVEENYL
jgi:hypothetical protein